MNFTRRYFSFFVDIAKSTLFVILHFWNKYPLGHYRPSKKEDTQKKLLHTWNVLWKWKWLKIRKLLQNLLKPISRLPRDFWGKMRFIETPSVKKKEREKKPVYVWKGWFSKSERGLWMPLSNPDLRDFFSN